jgi:hypothetical protein
MEFDTDSEDNETPLVMMMAETTPKDFVFIPITIQNQRFRAGLDSMSSLSFITPQVVKQLGVEVRPTKGMIKLGVDGVKTPRLGVTAPLMVRVGKEAFVHSFDVLNLTQGKEVIFGVDIFGKAGIGISGLPADFPERIEVDKTELRVLEQTNSSPPDTSGYKGTALADIAVSIDKDFGNKNPILYYIYQTKLRDVLHPLLAKNQLIKNFCNLPGAVVQIDVGQAKPVNKRQYRIEFRLMQVVDDQVKKWVDSQIIVENDFFSSWINPILVVPKRDSSGNIKDWRVCIDPRPLNLLIPSINFPLPLIRDIFEAFKSAKVFSKIDLKGGFNQFKIEEQHQEYTTFTWRGKQYRFVGSPFGFKHLPAQFQQVMTKLFGDLPCVLVYIDDIVIFSDNYSDHTFRQYFKG